MPTPSFLRRILLLPLLLLGFVTTPSRAQVQYATIVTSMAGIVTDESKAADGLLTTNAVIKPTLALGYTSLRVRFPAQAAAGKPAGMYIKPNVLISAALLGGATINTYTANSSTPIDSYKMSNSLLNVNVQPSGITQIMLLPKHPIEEMELVFFSAVALGQDIAVYEAYSTVNPLPVTLTSFQGKATSTGLVLNWHTASEHNSAYFEVERADHLGGSFQSLGRVASAGTTTLAHTYQFIDRVPQVLGYYRLRQVDLDGIATFSPVLALTTDMPTTGLSAYPIPTTDVLTVQAAAGTYLEILDQVGRLVQRLPSSPSSLQQVDVRNLPSGSYLIQDAATGKRLKFSKVNEK